MVYSNHYSIIGAVIGGTSGYLAGKSQGAKGWNMVGYIAGGAAIGAVSGGVAAGVTALGGGAMLAGATAGMIGGAGFSGLATGWDGKAMLKGAGIGALSGFAGGGIASAIGGGWGAFAGGAGGSGLSTLLYGGSGSDILTSMLLGGVMSYGFYELGSYVNWQYGGGKEIANSPISYKQFKAINTAYQKSRFWGREFGVYLNQDGSAKITPWSDTRKLSVRFSSRQGNINKTMHAHWAREGVDWVEFPNGNYARYDATNPNHQGLPLSTTVGGYHSPADFAFPGLSLVVGGTSSTYLIHGAANYNFITPDPFIRYFLFPWIRFGK